MTTFYISPSSLPYAVYLNIHQAAEALGWKAAWQWRRADFNPEAQIERDALVKAVQALAKTDVFIAVVPGTCSTNIEIGMAYSLCGTIFLAGRDAVHFTQTGLSDAYISTLPGITRVCCEPHEIPMMLKREYCR